MHNRSNRTIYTSAKTLSLWPDSDLQFARAVETNIMMLAISIVLQASVVQATVAPECAGCTVLSDTKCPDTAYLRTNSKSWQDCCSQCTADAQCNAWAFAPADQGNTCHLKHNVTSTHAAKGFHCGIFPGGGPTPPKPSPTPPPSPLPPTPPPTPADPSAPRPNFLFILQDDLGYDDIGFNNPESMPYSTALTDLAKNGMILSNHYVHWHCSPTRRSLLTGRLPVHHGEMLSSDTSDDMDLRWSIISQKLSIAGYKSYWMGKGHTGYKSMKHMPTHRGFTNWTGYMGGAQSYTASNRWRDAKPYGNTTYSSYLYGDGALDVLAQHDPQTPFFLYMAEQAVHAPYDAPPDPKPNGTVLQQMLWAADTYVGRVVALLKSRNMWNRTLVVFSADNGGEGPTVGGGGGTNWPKRGQKHTSFQGGMNGAAFISGGFLPAAHRGTSARVALHIVDWYATFCHLAGVDFDDGPPVPPLPIDPSQAGDSVLPPPKDLYGAQSWAAVDGVPVWDILLDAERRDDTAAAHASLTLSREVILVNGTLKLVVAQPDPSVLACKGEMPPHTNFTLGWRYRNHSWALPEAFDTSGCGLNFVDRTHFRPCLFDVIADPREAHDLSEEQPGLMKQLWRQLNESFLTYYHSRTPDEMLGNCDETCAQAYWKKAGSNTGSGPICGVDGC